MAKNSPNRKALLVGLLLAFILVMVIVKNNNYTGYVGAEGYVAAPAARVDARTYSGPGDAFRGPVEPGRRAVRRSRERRAKRALWYNPTTWHLIFY